MTGTRTRAKKTGRTQRAALALLGITISACDTSLPATPTSDLPLVYVILARDSVLPGDSVVSALVATAGTPAAATYRSVERFAMTRSRDGAAFAWRVDPTSSGTLAITPLSTAVPLRGNVILSRSSASFGLGRDSLEEGETYAFNIETQGVTVTGTVRVPDRPQPTRILRGGQEVVVWPRAPGAAGYVVRVETDWAPALALRDTEYVLKRDRPASEVPTNPRLIVTALDSNLTRFLTDTDARSAGVSGGYGLFGAMSTRYLPLLPPLR